MTESEYDLEKFRDNFIREYRLLSRISKEDNIIALRKIFEIRRNYDLSERQKLKLVMNYLNSVTIFFTKEVGNPISVGRTEFCRYFSWGIPTKEILDKIHKISVGKCILEIGSGKGLWAFLLEMRGCHIIPTDIHIHRQEEMFTLVEKLSAVDACEKYDCEILLIIWPPSGSTMAIDSLRKFKGDTFIYYGEYKGGCNATDEFFDELKESWINRSSYFPKNPRWQGLKDKIYLFIRK